MTAASLNFDERPHHAGRRRSGNTVIRGLLTFTMLLSLASVALIAPQPAPAGAQTLALSTADAAPADSLFFATLNVDPESDQFVSGQRLAEQSGLLDLLQAGGLSFDGMDPFLDILTAASGGEIGIAAGDELVDDLADSSGALPGDEDDADLDVSMGTSEDGWLVIMIRGQNPDDVAEAVLEAIETEADNSGQTVEESDYEGYTISSVTPGETDEFETTSGFAVAQVEDFVVIAETPELLEPAIDSASGAEPNLASDDNFDAVAQQLDGDYLLYAYLDGTALVETDTVDDTAAEELGLSAEMLAAVNAHTGLRVWADETAPGIRFDTVSIAAEDGGEPASSLNFDTVSDERVPSETVLFFNGNDLGQTSAVQLLLAVLLGVTSSDDFGMGVGTPVAGDDTDVLAGGVAEAILDLLTGEYVIAVSVPGVAALLDPGSLFLLVGSGVSDPIAAQAVVSAINDLVQESAGENTTFGTTEIDGDTIFTAENSEAGLPITVDYGVVGDELLIGLGDSVETFVEGPEESLADNEQYVATFDALGAPTEQGGIVYIDLLQIGELVQLFGGLLGSTTSGLEDADPACAEYADQGEAQAAYDEDPSGLLDLDNDFDGEACDDYFVAAGAEATPSLDSLDFSGIVSYGQVQYGADGYRGTNGLLLLDVEEE